MNTDQINVLHTLRKVMGFHEARQRVIADNVANANTPDFTPSDISKSEFGRMLEGRQSHRAFEIKTTHKDHFHSRTAGPSDFRSEETPDSETTANGNSVVIEEQMVRASENRIRFETALTLYQKSLGLIRMAAKSPNQ